MGKFIHYLVTWGGWVSVSYWLFALGYFIQKPIYKCKFAPDNVFDSEAMAEICQAENICSSDPRILEWEIDMEASKTLDNWQEKLDLMCAP